MRTDTPPPVRLTDYRPYPFVIKHVHLDFFLEPTKTRVRNKMTGKRSFGEHALMNLDGENLKLISIAINGLAVPEEEYEITPEGISIHMPAGEFCLEIETEISPETNTQLSGLYMSGGRFCTQCEAEGFRRITYYPDRPDVLAPFDVRMEADKDAYPYLLSNGNPVRSGNIGTDRHFAIWSDPHPKPSYLFALVAGDFDVYTDSFTTMSGKETPLAIYVDKGDSDRSAYAMDALKRSMSWDEDVFGREYDLDVFNIVAVRDFNFGAMENKGLNIFNAAYVLADGQTATDADFEAIESIVAHEYFHNWTGNRITCRDWFQLCLKEGLTVYRDQEFSADMRSRSVTRIKDVIRLRSRQFAEDAGPLAHAVRPDEYARIDNLYTATVYEKGAELIRMLRVLIGDTAFFAGLNRYFDSYDGKAATIEDFLNAMQLSTSEDLRNFARWYSQSGTPTVTAKGVHDTIARTYTLTLKQHTSATPGQPDKIALPIPLKTALFSGKGRRLSTKLNGQANDEHLLILRDFEQDFVFTDVSSAPIHSLNRGFSAPVRLVDGLNDANRSALAAADNDPFAQWEGLQTLARNILLEMSKDEDGDHKDSLSAFIDAIDEAYTATIDDPAFAALILRMPTVGELILDQKDADPSKLHATRLKLKRAIARHMQGSLVATVQHSDTGVFDPSAAAAGRRALKAAAIDLLSGLQDEHADRIYESFLSAPTMTEKLSALNALANVENGGPSGEYFDKALLAFEEEWKDTPIVMDKWFSVQAMSIRADLRARLHRLCSHPDFDFKNPNRVRAVAAAFAMNNPVGFHAPDGWGYEFLTDIILKVDGLNPALSARLTTSFESWRRFSPDRQAHAEKQLRRLDDANLSKNAQDIITRALALSSN
ncbi:aminopeptidase N [Hirschia baltica]|uniref:Aminopeptidase N n=1 Tax=Hirschia baltica (strain ATCC 49814 / DSM 5838 / IFAM 1418) TaxID=582402 RepID=C6XIN5_HIRBI|nr:aminopeptidase N [Hirschia baltica]ACT58980.1 aminopeptidase N [Hirschia baltica ATCC 49814]